MNLTLKIQAFINSPDFEKVLKSFFGSEANYQTENIEGDEIFCIKINAFKEELILYHENNGVLHSCSTNSQLEEKGFELIKNIKRDVIINSILNRRK